MIVKIVKGVFNLVRKKNKKKAKKRIRRLFRKLLMLGLTVGGAYVGFKKRDKILAAVKTRIRAKLKKA